MKKENISSLYVLKAVCAFMVVFIHTYKYGTLQTAVQPYIRMAVPSFLLISGYFMVGKDALLNKGKVRRILYKILKITIWAELMYAIASLLCGYGFGTSVWAIMLGEPVVHYGTHLWYLVAYIETLIFLLVYPFKKVVYLFYTIPLLVIINLLFGRYNAILGNYSLPLLYRSFMFTALPCVVSGMLIKVYEDRLKSFFIKRKWFLTSALFVLAYVEFLVLYFKLPGYGEFFLFTLPLSMSVFMLCLIFKDFGNNTYLEKIGRDYSLDIYIYHYLFYNILEILMDKSGYDMPNIFRFVIISIVALLFAVALGKVKSVIKRNKQKVYNQ